MITKESLAQKYRNLSDADLLEILSNQQGFTPLSIQIAFRELKKRNISDEVITNYHSVFSLKFDEYLDNWLVDLTIWQKILLYVIWIPVWREFITNNFYDNEYYLKVRQANYYLVTGVSFAILGALLYGWIFINFLVTWTAGFLLVYIFDAIHNKQIQIKNLEKLKEKGRRPDGFEI